MKFLRLLAILLMVFAFSGAEGQLQCLRLGIVKIAGHAGSGVIPDLIGNLHDKQDINNQITFTI